MNRLILIGNGFDLAHGMKTSYNDFILWYMRQCFVDAFHKKGYNDGLIDIQRSYVGINPYLLKDTSSVTNLIDRFYQDGFKGLIENGTFIAGNLQYSSPFNVGKNISPFLRTLLYNCSKSRWVDIENTFYSELKGTLAIRASREEKELRLTRLNESLRVLISQLEKYLNSLKQPEYLAGYMDILTSPIKKSDVHGIVLTEEIEPEQTLLLNFNYTPTPLMYLDWFKQNSTKVVPKINFIHGQLGKVTNPMIFGFGDELDDDYLRMEREEARGYFDYIKSFWYFKTSNYRDLVSFIDADPYQVFTLGHSCGLSDRTMLHMLFEHTNCKSVKIFFHGDKEGKNNYTTLTHEIARHFKDKAEMRNKIVSLDRSLPMPQG